MELVGLEQSQMDSTVWRYMSFTKFISLLTYQALWFSKLHTLQDKFEGIIPQLVKNKMTSDNQKWKKIFNAKEHHEQIDNWPSKNEEDGRELLVVNCWFMGEDESNEMWEQYGGGMESVAIKSTIGQLRDSVLVIQNEGISQLGKVSYVSMESHEMSIYEASQASKRAFLKDNKYALEQEIRILTMNFKTINCASPEGIPYKSEEVAGPKANNFENPGIYIGILLDKMISGIIVRPGSESWFFKLVDRIVKLSKLRVQVSRSSLDC